MTPVSLSLWQASPLLIPLKKNTVHLWRFSLADDSIDPDLLNAQERRRAQRLRISCKAKDFIVARTRLRQILGCYLKIDPRDVRFAFNTYGKPSLVEPFGRQIFFNLSHSGSWGLCAITRSWDVGVDLERVTTGLSYEPLAERFFSDEEFRWLMCCPKMRRRRNFFRLWTRKEAWLKGKGSGFSEPELSLNPIHMDVKTSFVDGWWLMNVPVTRGYIGAIAVAGKVEKIERWDWRG